MDQTNQVIDEYTLAAFIAGTLSEQRRAEVVAYLAENADARELLHMAYEALHGAETAGAPATAQPAPDLPARPPMPPQTSDRAAARRKGRRLEGAGRYVVAMAVVFTVGLGLRLAFGPPTDALRSPLPGQAGELSVQISPKSLTLRWSGVPDAYQYRVVVWDPQEARVVARLETTDTGTDRDDAFTGELREKLDAGQPYTLRIDAVDAQNRLLQSSLAIPFTPRP